MSLTEWKITDGTFKGFRFHLAKANPAAPFGITSQDMSVERRIQIAEMALLDGGNVEDFGRKASTYTVDVLFFGGDYHERIKLFDTLLNEGTTGELILPDLDTAVMAKFQKYGRKTTSSDGGTTVLTVSWIEDRVVKSGIGSAVDTLKLQDSGLTAAAANSPETQGASILQKADALLSSVTNNEFVSGINNVKNQINQAAITVNQQTAAFKQLVYNVTNIQTTFIQSITNLKSAVNGALTFIDAIKQIGQQAPAASAYTTALASDDFKQPDSVTVTTQPLSSTRIAVSTTVQPATYLSGADAANAIQAILDGINSTRTDLETQSNGKTKDVSDSALDLMNSMIDFIQTIKTTQSAAYLCTQDSSLLEVMFRNGIDLSRTQEIFKLNSTLPDTLWIQPLTVVYL